MTDSGVSKLFSQKRAVTVSVDGPVVDIKMEGVWTPRLLEGAYIAMLKHLPVHMAEIRREGKENEDARKRREDRATATTD